MVQTGILEVGAGNLEVGAGTLVVEAGTLVVEVGTQLSEVQLDTALVDMFPEEAVQPAAGSCTQFHWLPASYYNSSRQQL